MPSSARVRLLAAPDSFKGTFPAALVADLIADGARRVGAEVDALPLADGGEGTIDALLAGLGGRRITCQTQDPLGRPILADFALLADGGTAVVEVAQASGLGLVAERERDAERASSHGTGELIAAAVDHGARTVLVAAGGSATSDGGSGALAALGPDLGASQLVVLADVRTPFEQAAVVFGPQKGADEDAVERLTSALHAQAEGLFARDPRGVPGTGAAGGLAGALWATYGARIVSGADFVLDALGFDEALSRADAVVLGEGRLDGQTAQGKIVAQAARRAAARRVAAHAVVGSLEPDADIAALATEVGLVDIRVGGTPAGITSAGEAIARSLTTMVHVEVP